MKVKAYTTRETFGFCITSTQRFVHGVPQLNGQADLGHPLLSRSLLACNRQPSVHVVTRLKTDEMIETIQKKVNKDFEKLKAKAQSKT